nr:hypothetical protein HAGR004_28010 [Bdellovibrio sp. HAGR004]
MKLLKRFGTFAVYASVLLGASWVQAQSLGSLTVNGQAAPSQVFKKVKVAQCVQGQSGSCGKPVFFDLNVRQELPAGTYLVGFENTLYPGLVTVQAGRNTVLSLERLDVPAIAGDRVVVYRNLYSKIEQDKFLESFFYYKKSFFRLEKGNFGDLYLTGVWEKDVIQRLSYEGCPARLSEQDKKVLPNADADRIIGVDNLCNVLRGATTPRDLAGLFDFTNDKNGRIFQNWVSAPGIKMTITHDRYLVATPTRPGSYVMVFPGSYTVQALGKDAKAGVSVQVGM